MDAAAYTACYREVRPRLFAFLLRLVRDRQVAEDLLQEAFIKLARHADTLRPDTELAAWLFTVARNAAASHRRWQRADATRIFLFGLKDRDRVLTPEEESAATETQRRLEAALGRLSVADREVILLVAGEDFSPQQAATILGLSDVACRQRLTRARQRLAALMGEPV